MYGDDGNPQQQTDNQQPTEEETRLALFRKEAKAIADTNEAIHARVAPLSDATGQVRLYVTGPDRPAPGASIEELKIYVEAMIARIPALSPSAAWEFQRTFLDILEESEGEATDEVTKNRFHALIFRINAAQATADPRAAQGGLTATGALITQDRRETLNQTVRQQPLAISSPGIVDSLKGLMSGRRS